MDDRRVLRCVLADDREELLPGLDCSGDDLRAGLLRCSGVLVEHLLEALGGVGRVQYRLLGDRVEAVQVGIELGLGGLRLSRVLTVLSDGGVQVGHVAVDHLDVAGRLTDASEVRPESDRT